jgi:amino acid ABC transporter, permease protein
LQYILICGLIQWGFSLLEKGYVKKEKSAKASSARFV